ncbi:hypothetical protein PoB_007287900 [Plakobranchus ocellatus]|uniref:Uncharacterized protein n=1 Tax=Plakobranchus ocellatus TaxID=259542 RepID=A0AAV4DQ80_9GAST|nr:hypothetical protein PoB_007287900 [Plakobranchus ocellatus]
MCPFCSPANIKATVEPVLDNPSKKKCSYTVLSVTAQNTFTGFWVPHILTLCLFTFSLKWKVALSLKIILDSRSGSFSIDPWTMWQNSKRTSLSRGLDQLQLIRCKPQAFV